MSIRTTYGIYINARIHARRSELLTKPRYEEMLQCGDAAGIVRCLLGNPSYEKDMAEALLHGEGANAVEEAAGRNLDREFELLTRIVRREPLRAEAMMYFLNRWDLAAIKSLLRRGIRGESAGRFGLVTGPSLPWPVMERYAAQGRHARSHGADAGGPVSVTVRQAAAPACSPRATRNSLAPRRWPPLETALDRRYFERCGDFMWTGPRLAPVRAYLRLEVDRINPCGPCWPTCFTVPSPPRAAAHGCAAECLTRRRSTHLRRAAALSRPQSCSKTRPTGRCIRCFRAFSSRASLARWTGALKCFLWSGWAR